MDFQNRDNEKFCPSDRQLALRAKLRTGWNSRKQTTNLKPDEQEQIISVIKRNEMLESAERLRVGRLVERVENIKQHAADSGPRCCRLCGAIFGLLGPSKRICHDCQKPVCSKCSIELAQPNISATKPKEIILCKICSETRELMKKSGAWFFKSLPKYDIPVKPSSAKNTKKEATIKVIKTTKLGMEIEESSSSEDGDEPDKQQKLELSPKEQDTNIQREDSFRLHTVGSFRSFLERGERKLSNAIFFNRRSSRSENSQLDWDSISTISNSNRHDSLTSSYIRRGSVSSRSISESSSGNGSSSTMMTSNQQTTQLGPLGWLEVQVNYSEMDHTLQCAVLRARDLPAMDNAGLADPFCKLNIITPEGTTKQARWLRSRTVHKTKNPEFNENLTFLGVEPEELGNSVLYVVILDDDKFGHDFLGAAKIGLSTVYNQSPYRLTVPLCAEDQWSMEATTAGLWPRGHILISLSYNTKKRALVVMVKRCTDLLPMDNNGSSDPFVKLQLKPDSHRKKYKTSVKWRNLNPVFNEEFTFETRPNDLDKQCLLITVWDKDIGKSNDFLGSLVLGSVSKGRRLKQWQDCLRIPDHFHEQWHCLSSDPPSH